MANHNNPPATRPQLNAAITRVAQRCYFNKPQHEWPADPITNARVYKWREAYNCLMFYRDWQTPLSTVIRNTANALGLPWDDCITLASNVEAAIANHRTLSLDNGATYSCEWHPSAP